jgi:ubiquinone/menaquinone biosynthesis C-methylase UbiE
MKVSLRTLMFRSWYWYLNTIDRDADILFMNYGYNDPEVKIELEHEFEKNRYSIQLYHRLANAIDLKGKSLVEIGCGRGGGLAYIAKRFSTSTSLGIDLDRRAARFGNNHYKINGLKFLQGDAQNLPIDDNSYDVVLNVESSHRYPRMDLFLSEVKRILKPNGYFLYTDFAYREGYPTLEEALDTFGLTKIEGIRINDQVIDALKQDNERRQLLVKKLTPKFLHKAAENFAGVVGSKTYNQILAGDYEYFLYVFRKDAE